MSKVKPVAGQWYEWQEQRVYCVGQDSHGHTIVNNECGTLNILRGKLIEELKHLPDCTGWDWQPPQPAEDPEEWVEITDSEHVLREGVDFVSYKEIEDWFPVTTFRGKVLSQVHCIARCRRKDLPKPKRTVTVPKWLVTDDVGSTWICEQSDEPSGMTFIEVHRVGETTYEIEET